MNSFRLGSTRVALICITIAATCNRASGETIRIVSPPAAAGAEGGAVVTPPRVPLRIQYLIPASDFAGLPQSHRYIVGFNFRSDRTQAQPVDWIFPHEQAWISTTNRTSLTSVFDDNHGPDKTMVFDGTATFEFLSTGPAGGPRDFGRGPRFQTPFYYDPSQGNLLLELRDFDKNYPTPASIDLATISSGGNVRTLINEGNANGVTGVPVNNIVTPIQFEFAAIPEPSTLALTGLVLVGLVVCRTLRSRKSPV